MVYWKVKNGFVKDVHQPKSFFHNLATPKVRLLLIYKALINDLLITNKALSYNLQPFIKSAVNLFKLEHWFEKFGIGDCMEKS